ncbi:SCO4402 family protein [Cupriavidus basilensis]|uniref:SCO4402 family protein n=1 Tax=Cupriavidus basilensis TaxID=68895 RepID=UPI0009DB398A|nr:hypothetical protein [Cupriavidus basilensis]
MEKLELSKLKFPSMREELIDYLHGLSDKEYQYQAWVNHECPRGGYDELDYAIHFLYDDTKLASDPASTVGWILVDDKEVGLMENLIVKINIMFDKYGFGLDDKDYIEKVEWDDVVNSARIAGEYFSKKI